jgi:hypothetical protein
MDGSVTPSKGDRVSTNAPTFKTKKNFDSVLSDTKEGVKRDIDGGFLSAQKPDIIAFTTLLKKAEKDDEVDVDSIAQIVSVVWPDQAERDDAFAAIQRVLDASIYRQGMSTFVAHFPGLFSREHTKEMTVFTTEKTQASISRRFVEGKDGRVRQKRELLPQDFLPYDLTFDWTDWLLCRKDGADANKYEVPSCFACYEYGVALVKDGEFDGEDKGVLIEMPSTSKLWVVYGGKAGQTKMKARHSAHVTTTSTEITAKLMAIFAKKKLLAKLPSGFRLQLAFRFRRVKHAYQCEQLEDRLLSHFDYLFNIDHNSERRMVDFIAEVVNACFDESEKDKRSVLAEWLKQALA